MTQRIIAVEKMTLGHVNSARKIEPQMLGIPKEDNISLLWLLEWVFTGLGSKLKILFGSERSGNWEI